jgi:hypothetical protein
MNVDDQRLEEFLRGFEPRRPRPLPVVSGIWHDGRRLASAAVMLVAVGASLWMVFRSPQTKSADRRPVATQDHRGTTNAVRSISSTAWTRAALEDRDEFDAQMNDIAPRTLPRFDRPDSSLRGLATQ